MPQSGTGLMLHQMNSVCPLRANFQPSRGLFGAARLTAILCVVRCWIRKSPKRSPSHYTSWLSSTRRMSKRSWCRTSRSISSSCRFADDLFIHVCVHVCVCIRKERGSKGVMKDGWQERGKERRMKGLEHRSEKKKKSGLEHCSCFLFESLRR